ncbi:MAG TPA: Ldh family oxidoreductase [Candidatus Dormibacteraeota bacterium]|nr:Ldh family oxidoreductase [Candidatus Dormibacteraeota bacterium]
MSPHVVHEEPLRRFIDGVCRALGAPAESAADVAEHLYRTSLAGHDAQGVARLPDYVAEADAGLLVPAAATRLLRETAVTAVLDAGRGFGPHSTAVALAWCVERARTSGLAAAAVRRSSPVGWIGEYATRAAEAGLLAIVTVGAAGTGAGDVMLYGGRERFLGVNPWTFAVPGRERSLLAGGPTSTVSHGDVRLARAKGGPLPADCVYDRYGRPSTDPDDFFAGGGLVPLGGAVAGERGSGLGLASALFGGLGTIDGDESGVGGVFVEVIDPGAFGDAGAYRDLVDGALAAARTTRPTAGRSEVPVPGGAEARARAERARSGIRLTDATWADLDALAGRFGVPLPMQHEPQSQPSPSQGED